MAITLGTDAPCLVAPELILNLLSKVLYERLVQKAHRLDVALAVPNLYFQGLQRHHTRARL